MTTHLHRMARYWRSCAELFAGVVLVGFVAILFLRLAWVPVFNTRLYDEWSLWLITALAIAVLVAVSRAHLLAQGKWLSNPDAPEKRDAPVGALAVPLMVWVILSLVTLAFLVPLIVNDPFQNVWHPLTEAEEAQERAWILRGWRLTFALNAVISMAMISVAWGVWRWRNRSAPDPAHFLGHPALWTASAIGFAGNLLGSSSKLKSYLDDRCGSCMDWHPEAGIYQLDGPTPTDHVLQVAMPLALALLGWAAWRRA